jgi:hypothetical protein
VASRHSSAAFLGLIGYSQYLRLPVIQIAELGGVYAVSLLIVAVNAAIAGCFVPHGVRRWVGSRSPGRCWGGRSPLAPGAWRSRSAGRAERGGHAALDRAALKFDPAFGPTTLAIYLT